VRTPITAESEEIMHTKGKWYVNKAAAQENTARVTCDTGMIAECSVKKRANGEAFANAKLIAAAPDLLEACEALLKTITRQGIWPLGPDNKPIPCGNIKDVENVCSVQQAKAAIDKATK
jgi:hypothetical protein